jgi:DNA-binding LytR/AlgR family response regulator
MATIKVGIVEDDMLIGQSIANTLRQLGYEPTEPAISYTEALEMIEQERPDILLLDIELSGKKDGIDLAMKLQETHAIPFIFLTAYSDTITVERAKKANPPAYLVKPFNKNDLYASIEICLNNFEKQSGKSSQSMPQTEEKDTFLIKGCVFIKQGQNYQKIKVDDILYLENDKIYINVHTVNNKLLVRSTIQNYMDMLDAPHFLQIHKSYAVNTNYVDSVNAESVFVRGTELPIGRAYKDEFFRAMRIS